MKNPFNENMSCIDAQITYLRAIKGKTADELAQIDAFYSSTLDVILKKESDMIARGCLTEYSV